MFLYFHWLSKVLVNVIIHTAIKQHYYLWLLDSKTTAQNWMRNYSNIFDCHIRRIIPFSNSRMFCSISFWISIGSKEWLESSAFILQETNKQKSACPEMVCCKGSTFIYLVNATIVKWSFEHWSQNNDKLSLSLYNRNYVWALKFVITVLIIWLECSLKLNLTPLDWCCRICLWWCWSIVEFELWSGCFEGETVECSARLESLSQGLMVMRGSLGQRLPEEMHPSPPVCNCSDVSVMK